MLKNETEVPMKGDIFSSRLLQSRVHSENTTKSEQILGYFVGPCLVYMMYSGVAGAARLCRYFSL